MKIKVGYRGNSSYIEYMEEYSSFEEILNYNQVVYLDCRNNYLHHLPGKEGKYSDISEGTVD